MSWRSSPPRVARRCPGEEGFTLAEMLVVLAILSLCLSVAVPSLRAAMGDRGLSLSAKEVASLLRSARAEAISSAVPARISFDLDRNVVSAGWSTRSIALPEGAGVTLLTASNEVLSASDASFAFFPDGTATGGSILLRSGRDTQAIRIDWLTGGVERGAALE